MTGKRRKGKDPVPPPSPPDPPQPEAPQPEPPPSEVPDIGPPPSEIPDVEPRPSEVPDIGPPPSEIPHVGPPPSEGPHPEPPYRDFPDIDPPRSEIPPPEVPRELPQPAVPSEVPQPEPPPSEGLPFESASEPEAGYADHPDRDPEVEADDELATGPPTPPPALPPIEPAPTDPIYEPLVAPRISRRQARLERKRQQRRRVGLLGGSVIAVVVIVIAAAAAVGVHHVVTKDGGPSNTQTTLLLQVQAPNRTAQASALLADNPSDGNGVEVLVPSHVITDVCGYNTVNFGDVLALPDGETASREAVSGMLDHLTVNGSWVMQPAQLSKLVGLVGGITVDVDVNVMQHSHGGSQVLVQAGPNRKLTGDQAAAYATYSTSRQEDASAQLARLQQVIDATVQKLPNSSTEIAAMIRQLGPGAGSTLGVSRLATMLVGFAAAERGTGRLLPIDLPVTSIDTGGAPSYRVDTVGASRLAHGSLVDSLPSDAQASRPTVELLNGVGEPGLVATACPRLAANHLAYAGSGNAATFHNPTSTVVVSTSNVDLGYQVASALRLPRSDVRRTSQDQSVADVIVTLGDDYKP